MSQTRILNLVFALLVIFFGWRSYEAWTKPVAVVISPSSGTSVTPIGTYQPDTPAVPADLSANVASIVARPVFRPDRKQFSEGVSGFPQRNYDAELSRFTLLGVLQIGDDNKGIVVGKGPGARDERWEAGPGDALPGFRVKSVGVEGMTLTADGREFLLPLYAGGPKGAAGQAAVRTDPAPRGSQPSKPQPAPAGGTVKPSSAAQPVAPPSVAAPSGPMKTDPGSRRRLRPFPQQERPAMPASR